MSKWTREEEIIVFNLYCKIPFKSSSKNNPDVIRVAELLGTHSPSAVNMKIGNFGRFDPKLKAQGITGLKNGSKLDEEIWNEFNFNWDKLAYESEKLIEQLNNKKQGVINIQGGTVNAVVKQRINQGFFRNSVLACYNGACCITGLCNNELLIASHIKPWKDSDPNEKVNPSNGLLLNALHDKAFDRGLITVDTDYKIIISKNISDICDNESVKRYFLYYENKKINLPEKFMPCKEFLEYHNNNIFEKV